MSTYTTALHHVTVCRSADGRLYAYARCSEAGQLVRHVIHDRGQPDRHPGRQGSAGACGIAGRSTALT